MSEKEIEREFLQELGEEFYDPSWWVEESGKIRPVCLYDGVHYLKCSNNDNGLCITELETVPKHLCHYPDANNWKCPCG